MSITRIVLTGGPCAGKSTGLSIIEQRLKNLGYTVIIMDEMATNVLKSGLHPDNIGNPSFQKVIAKLQLDRDKVYMDLIGSGQVAWGKPVVILYDRGILDGKAYCNQEEMTIVLNSLNVKENSVRDSYNGVFHLVTAADGAEEFYGNETNSVRLETAEEARVADKKTLNSWIGHPHLRVINNIGMNFEQKMLKLAGEIMGLLGEPEPLEIERKFLIQMPDLVKLSDQFKLTKSEIIQTYLTSADSNVERRVRQRGTSGDHTYYYTEKVATSEGGTRTEREKIITQGEYVNLLLQADTTRHQIRKDRYCFVYMDKYFELDIYPFWGDKAILEIELSSMSDNFDIPEEIVVIAEVTTDKNYSNYSLSTGHTEHVEHKK